MNYIKNCLIDFGLSDLAAEIYLLLIQSPELTAAQIAQEVGKSRPNIYPQLKVLVSHDLIEELPKQRGFRVTHPANLRNLIASEQLRIQQLSLTLESTLPELIRQRGTNTQGSISTTSVKDGWDTFLKLLLHTPSKQVIHLRGSQKPLEEVVSLPRELSRRAITLTAFIPATSAHKRIYAGPDSVYKTVHSFLDPEIYPSLPELILTETIVCIIQDNTLTVCDNLTIINSYFQLIETLDTSTEKQLQKLWRKL